MLKTTVKKLIEQEMNASETKEYQEIISQSVIAVEKALTSGMQLEVEQAKEAVQQLQGSDLKKALNEVLRAIPYREQIENLNALKEKGLYIIDEDDSTVENHIMTILQEKHLLVSDLAKLTGISRQNINAVVKNKMKPGIDFALKVSHVLGIPVEELFTLTENAWVKPYKQEKDATLYVDVIGLVILDTTAKKEEITKNGHEYYDLEAKKYLTRDEQSDLLKEFLKNETDSKVNELKLEGSDLTTTKLVSQAKEELRKEFNKKYSKVYKKLGEKITPYVINSKKVVSSS